MRLTRTEKAIYDELTSEAGNVVSINDLTAVVETVRKDEHMANTMNGANLIAVHIRNLRKKLSETDGIERIESVRGVGYLINIE